jgi:hypothetical protein
MVLNLQLVMISRLPSYRMLPLPLLLLLVILSHTSALPGSGSDQADRSSDDDRREAISSPPTTTLREYLGQEEGLYLAMGPAFFGFYGYFGALAGIEDELYHLGGLTSSNSGEDQTTFSSATSLLIERKILRGVSGASAGAMAAVALAAGISPHRASEFVSMFGLGDFADMGGLGAFMKGNRFESIMSDFLQSMSPIVTTSNTRRTDTDMNATATTHSQHQSPLRLEDAIIPVAVSATDVHPKIAPLEPSWLQMQRSTNLGSSWLQLLLSSLSYVTSTYIPTPKILRHGSMARAARASACFPGLFQPVGWIDRISTLTSSSNDNADTSSYNGAIDYSLLIDGGIFDWAGYNGLKEIINTNNAGDHGNSDDDEARISQKSKIRVLNMVVGGFGTAPPGPKAVSKTLDAAVDSVLSLSISGLPNCGPLTMENGPLAISAARMALRAAMDRPIGATTSFFTTDGTIGGDGKKKRQHHYVLEIDASSFVDEKL